MHIHIYTQTHLQIHIFLFLFFFTIICMLAHLIFFHSSLMLYFPFLCSSCFSLDNFSLIYLGGWALVCVEGFTKLLHNTAAWASICAAKCPVGALN